MTAEIDVTGEVHLQPWELELMYGSCSKESTDFVLARLDAGLQGPLTEEADRFEKVIIENARRQRLVRIVDHLHALTDVELSELYRSMDIGANS